MPSLLRALALSGLLVIPASALPANLARVDGKVWRSAQPEATDFAELRQQGITTVLNLREWHSDAAKAEGSHLSLQRVRMNAGSIPEQDLARAVKILKDAPGPVLVHCWHGSDRTGTVVALYRMAVQGWPRERAIAEFTDPRYGYHAGVYPNLRHYLEQVDLAAFKRAMTQAG
ncbi:tyrosine-protein phosphatase [Luteolibacter sp. LG18]|uniref:phosphatase domain-containing putative toxin n=1 Tax=Luteolibacter sp. LG18 TaxID=2819286 RepID=UPI002B2E0461|nr:protein-tyrosine-phosphatase [Luteolibacter sp. LG18]